jgi:hypothetical protein
MLKRMGQEWDQARAERHVRRFYEYAPRVVYTRRVHEESVRLGPLLHLPPWEEFLGLLNGGECAGMVFENYADPKFEAFRAALSGCQP